jgi:hypothetical protein
MQLAHPVGLYDARSVGIATITALIAIPKPVRVHAIWIAALKPLRHPTEQ